MTGSAAHRPDRPAPSTVPSTGLARRAFAEGTATAFLLCVIVGSGVMADRLSQGDAAFTLLANSVATGAGLIALILAFGPVSGAHLNPIVTVSEAWRGSLPWAHVPAYVLAQIGGAFTGVAVAHGMFGERLFSIASHRRTGLAQVFSELVATFGLVVVIRGSARLGIPAVALSVGSYIGAAYWFTSSTSFANPAVALGRALTDTFTGIRPQDVPGFLLGEALGGAAAIAFLSWTRIGDTETSRR